jgi:uncharacterized integral membrane protein
MNQREQQSTLDPMRPPESQAPTPTPAPSATPPQTETPPQQANQPTKKVRRLPRTRAGGLWAVLVVFALVLLFLLIFILQNLHRADVHFLGLHGNLPLGVALLLSAVAGILLVALPAVVRMVQLRLTARRRGRKANEQQALAESRNPAHSA